MTTPEPTAEHIDAVAKWLVRDEVFMRPRSSREIVRDLLTTTDPDAQAALAANLPREVMLAALVADGTLTECENTPLPGWRFYQGEVRP